MNNHDVLPLHMANSKNKVHLIVTNHVLRFGVDAQLKMQILKWFQLYFAFINYYCPQHPRATAITFEFRRHIDTYTKIPQHPKIPNLFSVKLKK